MIYGESLQKKTNKLMMWLAKKNQQKSNTCFEIKNFNATNSRRQKKIKNECSYYLFFCVRINLDRVRINNNGIAVVWGVIVIIVVNTKGVEVNIIHSMQSI